MKPGGILEDNPVDKQVILTTLHVYQVMIPT